MHDEFIEIDRRAYRHAFSDGLTEIAVALFFLVLLLLPLFTGDPYLLRILILTSIFAIFAASWDLLSGFTGQMNFGHALFFGVGAYTAAAVLSIAALVALLSARTQTRDWDGARALLGPLDSLAEGQGHRAVIEQWRARVDFFEGYFGPVE